MPVPCLLQKRKFNLHEKCAKINAAVNHRKCFCVCWAVQISSIDLDGTVCIDKYWNCIVCVFVCVWDVNMYIQYTIYYIECIRFACNFHSFLLLPRCAAPIERETIVFKFRHNFMHISRLTTLHCSLQSVSAVDSGTCHYTFLLFFRTRMRIRFRKRGVIILSKISNYRIYIYIVCWHIDASMHRSRCRIPTADAIASLRKRKKNYVHTAGKLQIKMRWSRVSRMHHASYMNVSRLFNSESCTCLIFTSLT